MSEKRYTEADLLKAIDQAKNSAKLHNRPSQETKDFMKQTKETFEKIEAKIDELPTRESLELSNEKLLKKVLEEVKGEFVSKEEFKPVRLFVYGFMSIVGASALIAVLNLIFVNLKK